MTFDNTVHIGELLILVGAAWAVFKGGIGMRDAVRDLVRVVEGLKETSKDHEGRLRVLEFGDRRKS